MIFGFIFLGGLILGYLLSEFIQFQREQKEKNQVRGSFYSILTTIEAGDCVFVNRINELVVVGIDRGIFSGHVITMNINDRILSVSHNHKAVLVSDFIRVNFPDDKIIDQIIDQIQFRFGDKIDDTVVVNGVKIDRDFLNKTMKETNTMSDFMGQPPIVDTPEEEPEISVDEILDKILREPEGIDSLSIKEREILDKRSRDD